MGYAYSVAVKLSVANLASQGLRLIASDMLKAHGAAVNLQSKLSALKLAAVGFGVSRAGLGIFHGLEKTVGAAREYTSQLSLMNAAGMSHLEIANSIGAAWSTSRSVLTSTAAENLRQLRELRSLFGTQHMSEAYAILPNVMRTQGVMEALTGRKNEKIGFEMAKVAELRQTGVMTLPFLQRNIDELSRTLMAMGGTITASDYLMTMKYAKTAALSFSDRFVYQELPTLIQEVKSASGGMMGNASQAGTALMTLYSAIVQGKMPKAAIPIWLATGLVHPSDIVRNATGGFQIRPGAVEGSQLFQQDPFLWAQKIAPQLERYAAAHHLNMLQLISNMFGARNAQWMMNTLIAKAPQIVRDQQLIQSTPSTYESYQRLLKTNPLLAEQALHAQWQNVLSILGYSVLPKVLPLMVSFAKDLNSLAGWFQKHPKLTSALVIDLGALAGGLVFVGNVMMTRAVLQFLGLGPALSKMFTTTVSTAGVALAKLSAVATAATAGYLVGTEIWKHALAGTKVGDWIGSAVAHVLAFFGDKTAKDAIRINSVAATTGTIAPARASAELQVVATPRASYIVSRGPTTTVIPIQLNVDGKKMAAVTARHLTDALGRPQTGTSIFDGRQALVPAGGL